ncbi:Cyanovirin-N [Trichoderma cornu-damae]|uniref:Cyanovirin-N n=1 Tax=Trichoderma cornu-damae TaxID=654480 RepID=A0A9P8TU79_9HYPO|nr:Cyanovirin-N [Trichoderma cornu-damae]
MSFEATAQHISLERGHILRASVKDQHGNWTNSEINLDEFIGNQDGWFMWDGVTTTTSYVYYWC